MNRTGFTSSEWDREKRNDGMEVYETVSGQSPSGHAKQRVKLSTLGCRLNQYESQAIREQFLRAGYTETRDSKEADVFVLNTCTVTGESDRESRYQIRRFHRENPKGKIVVTGCYVERNRNEIESIPG